MVGLYMHLVEAASLFMETPFEHLIVHHYCRVGVGIVEQ